jgi:hypothetical protein
MLVPDVTPQIKPIFEAVLGAANIQEALKEGIGKRSNAAFLLPGARRPGRNERATGVGRPFQKMELTFAVLIAVRTLKDPLGKKATGILEQLVRQLEDSLLGYTPPQMDTGILLAGGRLVKLKDGELWWQEMFKTSYYTGG